MCAICEKRKAYTPREINEIIAAACDIELKQVRVPQVDIDSSVYYATVDSPDFVNDEAALREARKTLLDTPQKQVQFMDELAEVVEVDLPPFFGDLVRYAEYQRFNSETAQKALALVNTIGKL